MPTRPPGIERHASRGAMSGPDRQRARRGPRSGRPHHARGRARGCAGARPHRAEGARACWPAWGWREAVFERVDGARLRGRAPRASGASRACRRDHRRRRLDPRRRARGAELPRPAVRGGDAHRALRTGRRGHGRAHPRHAQDHARSARAREGGRAGRRRDEPPQRALRRDPREGEPRRAGRGRGGGPRRATGRRSARA